MFGKKGNSERKVWAEEPMSPVAPGDRLAGPSDIPELAGRCLVVDKKKDPEWAWKLKAVLRRKATSRDEDAYWIRIYSDSQVAAKKVFVKNFTSLDGHPDLVLYEGWFDKKLLKWQIDEKAAKAAA